MTKPTKMTNLSSDILDWPAHLSSVINLHCLMKSYLSTRIVPFEFAMKTLISLLKLLYTGNP